MFILWHIQTMLLKHRDIQGWTMDIFTNFNPVILMRIKICGVFAILSGTFNKSLNMTFLLDIFLKF